MRNVLVLWMICGVVGCATTDEMAPPVSDAMLTMPRANGHVRADLERGRRVYLVDCTSCHTIEPIAGYSYKQWEITLEEMAVESNLSQQQFGDLAAYVLSAHQLLEEQPPALKH